VIKKATPVVKKPAETMPAETVATPPAMQPETQSSAATPSKTVTSPQSTPFTEANFKANYLHNPAPEYPQLARNREWQGNVMLRVKVSSEGLCEGIALETSSGHEMLDDAAMEAVKKWQFVPAKRGEIAEASTVLVPIKFKLTEN
jgi:protein TonB